MKHLLWLLFGILLVAEDGITSAYSNAGTTLSSQSVATLASICANTHDPVRLLTLSRNIAEASLANLKTLSQDSVGPTLTVGIVTYASSNIWPYAAYTFAINLAYAEHNGYTLQMLDEHSTVDFTEEDSRWNKIKILERALDPADGWARDFDLLVWVDADLVVLDFSFRIESLLQTAAHLQASIFVSAEHAGSSTLINSGCIVVRNTLWARRFLSEWWSYADRTLFSDQEQFDLLYEHKRRQAQPESLFTHNIVILPPDKLNSDPPAMTMQKPYNEVLHLMGEQSEYRVKVFQSGVQEICRHIHAIQQGTTQVALAPQLNLTQANLLRWAGEVYAAESAGLLREYEAMMPAQSRNTDDATVRAVPQSLAVSRDLANSVHHYAYALTNSADVTDSGVRGSKGSSSRYRTAITARKKVYQLLRRNLVAWKRLKPDPRAPTVRSPVANSDSLTFEDIRLDWPELLKITSIAGQHLLSITDKTVLSLQERRHVAGEILLMMQEMMGESHPSQHSSILLMVADIHQQIGVMDLQESQEVSNAVSAESDMSGEGGEGSTSSIARELIVSALQHFELSLDVNRQIAEKTGEHILVSPLVLTANALASLEQFDEAFGHYRQAISLNERHLGTQHVSNIPLLVDFGISLVHAGECSEAASVIDRALSLIEGNDVPQDSVEYKRALLYKQKIAIKCEF